MFRKLVTAVALSAGVFAAPQADAEIVRVGFRGVITGAGGVHAAAFQNGQAVEFSYELDTNAADSNPAADAGVFNGGLRALRVVLPAQGINATTTDGVVQTFNNVGSSPTTDQVFVYGRGMASPATLRGAEVTNMEVDFMDYPGTPGAIPTMITSDALPTAHLVPTHLSVALYTGGDRTYVWVEAEPAYTPAELVADAVERIRALATSGAIRGVAPRLTSRLQALRAASATGNTLAACGWLAAYRTDVLLFTRMRLISASASAELLAYHDELRTSLGGC